MIYIVIKIIRFSACVQGLIWLQIVHNFVSFSKICFLDFPQIYLQKCGVQTAFTNQCFHYKMLFQVKLLKI